MTSTMAVMFETFTRIGLTPEQVATLYYNQAKAANASRAKHRMDIAEHLQSAREAMSWVRQQEAR